MVKKNSIPERWRNLTSVGQRIPGSRFIAFKVPLKGVINQRVTQIQKFTPKDLLNAIRTQNEELGLIIDLTNTERYYTIKDLPKSVQYVKMHTAGLKIPDDSTIHQFKRIVRRFIWNNSENDKLIGVHCTTGINRTGYLICRYLIDVDGWDPETAVNTFSECRGHPIEASVYREDLVSGPTRSNLGIDQPPSDDSTIPMRKESNSMEEESTHPFSADRRKAIEAFMEARRRTEQQQTMRKLAAQKALRDEFGDFDAREKMQDFDARDNMQELRQTPLSMRDRSPDYRDIEFFNSMGGPRERPFSPREAMDDCEFPGPFEQRERFFHGNMRDQDMMHPDEYRRMQFERREMRGGPPMDFESDMYMEDCDPFEMGPREMQRPNHNRQSDMSRENLDYDDVRHMGRFGNHPGPSRMFSEEDDFEDGSGGPMSHPFPGPFARGGSHMDDDDVDEMEARRRFERNRAMKAQSAMNMEQFRSIDDHGHMPGPMRSRPVEGPGNERMRPMGEGMRQMDERMRPKGERMRPMNELMHPTNDGMRPMDDRLRSMGDGMRPMGDGMRPMGEGMRPMGDGMRPMGEGMRTMGDGMRPMGEGMRSMGDGMRPMGEGMRSMGDGMRPMGEGMRSMGDGMRPMGEGMRSMGDGMRPMGEGMRNMGDGMRPMGEGMRTMGDGMRTMGRPMSDRMPPSAKGMYPMDEQMHPMNKRMRPMEERGRPMEERGHPMDERGHPMDDRMRSMDERMYPMSERMGSMNEGMQPKDARLPMNKPNSIPGPMRHDPLNERNPRLPDGRKMPSEDMMQGGKRFAPYPPHMKAMQPNKERPGSLPAASMNYNFGMPNSNQNKQGYMHQPYPSGKMFN